MRRVVMSGLFCLFALSASGCGSPVEIIAHRGASYDAPENTMSSILLAWQKRADVEVDVYLSRDNRIVVIHDATTKRTAGVDLKVKETKEWIPHDPSLVQKARDNGLDGIDADYNGVTEEFAHAVKASGLKFYVWTVDDPQEASRLVNLGVDGITTNRPDWLRERLKSGRSAR